MLVLGIDPGSMESAFVAWDGKRIHIFDKVPNAAMLVLIRDTLRSQTDLCIIEMIGHYGTGMPAGKTVFDTCVWIGRFGERYGWDRVRLILRPTIKAHICGSARATDSNIRQAIIDRFGGKDSAIGRKASPGPLFGVSADEWSALAVGLTWIDEHQAQLQLQEAEPE